MTSLLYKITRRPRTIEDCLDLAGSVRADSLRLELAADEFVSEYDQVTRLCGWLIWDFQGRIVRCRPVLALVRPDDSVARKSFTLRKANKQLADLLEGLKGLGYDVTNGSATFTDQMLADGGVSVTW